MHHLVFMPREKILVDWQLFFFIKNWYLKWHYFSFRSFSQQLQQQQLAIYLYVLDGLMFFFVFLLYFLL